MFRKTLRAGRRQRRGINKGELYTGDVTLGSFKTEKTAVFRAFVAQGEAYRGKHRRGLFSAAAPFSAGRMPKPCSAICAKTATATMAIAPEAGPRNKWGVENYAQF